MIRRLIEWCLKVPCVVLLVAWLAADATAARIGGWIDRVFGSRSHREDD